MRAHYTIICLGAESSQGQSPLHHTNKRVVGTTPKRFALQLQPVCSASIYPRTRQGTPSSPPHPGRLGTQRVHKRRRAPAGRLSKQSQCRCGSLGAFARMHALKIINRWRWRRRCGCDCDCCLSGLSPAARLHDMSCPVPGLHVRHWSPPTYLHTSLARPPPGSPNASLDSAPEPHPYRHHRRPQGEPSRPHPPRPGPALSSTDPPTSGERPPGETHAPCHQAMRAPHETRGYIVLGTARYTKHQASGKSSCGALPRTSPVAGGHLQLTATIHVCPCSPARTNTTLSQRPSWHRQKERAHSASISQPGTSQHPTTEHLEIGNRPGGETDGGKV